MSTSNSRQSYEDCYGLMDSALTKNIGVRVGFDTEGEAKHFRVRVNYARTLDQKFNMSIYEGADPRRGKSDYDALVVRNPKYIQERWWVYIEHRKAPKVIEEIKEDGDEPKVATFRR